MMKPPREEGFYWVEDGGSTRIVEVYPDGEGGLLVHDPVLDAPHLPPDDPRQQEYEWLSGPLKPPTALRLPNDYDLCVEENESLRAQVEAFRENGVSIHKAVDRATKELREENEALRKRVAGLQQLCGVVARMFQRLQFTGEVVDAIERAAADGRGE